MGKEKKKLSQSEDHTIRRSFILYLVLIGLTALLMRVIVGQILYPPHQPLALEHFTYATNLYENGVFSGSLETKTPTSMRMPFYALALVGVRFFSGKEQWLHWTIVIHYVTSALACVLLALLGTQLIRREVGLLAGFLAAFYMDYIYVTIMLLRENPSIFMLLALLNCFVLFLKHGGKIWFLLGSLIFGIAVLNRPEVTLVGLLLLVLEWKRVKNRLRGLKQWVLVGVLLAVGPGLGWTIRNYNVHGHFLPFSSDGAWGFYMGQVYPPDEAYTKADPAAIDMINATPVEYDWVHRMNQEAFQSLLHHPFRNMFWGVLKIRDTFQEFLRGRWGLRYSVIILMGAIGFPLLILREKIPYWKVMVAPFLTLIVTVVLFIAHYRNRVFLFDWVLLLGTSHLFFEGVAYLRTQARLRFNS